MKCCLNLILVLWICHLPLFSMASPNDYECSELSLDETTDSIDSIIQFTTPPYQPYKLLIQKTDQPLKVQLDSLEGFSNTVEEKVFRAVEILNEILDSEEFYQSVKNHIHDDRHAFAKNARVVNGRLTTPLSNEDLYRLIQLGQEVGTDRADGKMNLRLKMVRNLGEYTVAQTHLFSYPISVNASKYNHYGPRRIAANLMHEWLHNMGFSHTELSESDRQKSIPYGVGKIVEQLAGRYK